MTSLLFNLFSELETKTAYARYDTLVNFKETKSPSIIAFKEFPEDINDSCKDIGLKQTFLVIYKYI